MTTLTTPRLGILLIFAVGFLADGSHAEESPHWSKTRCQACHVEATPTDGIVNLNGADAEELCESCHGARGNAKSCHHASGLPAGNMTIPESLQSSLKGGQIVCSTCHDIIYQCKNARIQYSYQNPGFLRDRTSRASGGYCMKCHDGADYEKLNPHSGAAGSPLRATCILCHSSLPETSATGQLVVEFNMRHDLNDTCFGCHKVRPHPGSMSFSAAASERNDEWVHFVKPSETVLENMREAQAETGIGLPLDPHDGEIFCATCHNPHDFKVGGEHGSESPAAADKLRTDNICQVCHDK